MADLAERLGMDPRVSRSRVAGPLRVVGEGETPPRKTPERRRSWFEIFCQERQLDPKRLRSTWSIREQSEGGRPVLLYPTPVEVNRVKFLDGKKPKYRWLRRGGRMHWYGLKEARALGGRLYIVNGEPSVWAAHQSGVAAVCLCGETAPPGVALVQELRDAGYNEVSIVYDRDLAGWDGAQNLIEALTAGGIIAIAFGLPEELGLGGDVDDLHRRVGDAGLTEALAALPSLAPREDLAALEPELDESALNMPARRPRGELLGVDGESGFMVDRERTAIYTSKGAPHIAWCPRVLAHVWADSGSDGQASWFDVEVQGFTERIAAAELHTGECWDRFPKHAGSAGRANAHLLENIVLQFGGELELTRGYSTTGFHHLVQHTTSHWLYLLPDGRWITGPGGEEARAVLVGYSLDERQPIRAREFADQLATVPAAAPTLDQAEQLFTWYACVAPEGHLLITVGAALRSLVHSLVPAATVLIAEGPAGTGKTSSAMHARGVLGPSPHNSGADAMFRTSPTGLELDVAPIRDAPCVVDNFRPTDPKLLEQLDALLTPAESGNEIRSRATRDVRKRRGNRISTLLLITGEQLPQVLPSHLRRMMLLPYKRGLLDVDSIKLQERQFQPILTRAGHAVIRLILERLTENHIAWRQEIERQEAHYADALAAATSIADAQREISLSVVANWARVLTGLWLLEQAVGLRTGPGRSDDGPWVTSAQQCLPRYIEEQLERMADASMDQESGAERFCQLLLEAFGSRRAYVTNREGGIPEDPTRWGWEPTESYLGGAPYRHTAGALLVGELIKGWLFLNPSTTYTLAVEAAKRSGQFLTVDERALWAALDEAGLIETEQTDGRVHRLVRVRRGGRTGVLKRVLKLSAAALTGVDDEIDADSSLP